MTADTTPIPAEAEISEALEAGPTPGIKTQHAELLNRLDQMQQSPYYATARSVLAQAESLIVEQEAELQRLRQECEGLRKDAERLDWIEKNPGCNLVSDDGERWGWSTGGMQPVPEEGGFTEMVGITSLIEPGDWRIGARAALDAAMEKDRP